MLESNGNLISFIALLYLGPWCFCFVTTDVKKKGEKERESVKERERKKERKKERRNLEEVCFLFFVF